MIVLHLALVVFASVKSENYFIVDYTGLKSNCKNEEFAIKLHRERPHQCYNIYREEFDERAWEECKRRLSSRLIASCPNNKIKKVILDLLKVKKIK